MNRLLGGIVLALVAVPLLWVMWIAGHLLWYRSHAPAETSFMAQRMDEAREKNPKARRDYRWVSYERISNNLKRAVIASEDAKFLDHRGFDWQGIRNAMEKNRRQGKIVGGGSTITQQLAKNLFLSANRSYWRKGQEAAITMLMEAMLSKRRILELYLNVIEWGDGIFGAEAAARHYFGTSAAELSILQAARLAAMTPSPRVYQKNPMSLYLLGRAGTIVMRMPSATVP